jgi:hypothetical protein
MSGSSQNHTAQSNVKFMSIHTLYVGSRVTTLL